MDIDAVRQSVTRLRQVAGSAGEAASLTNMAQQVQVYEVGGHHKGADPSLTAMRSVVGQLNITLPELSMEARRIADFVTKNIDELAAAVERMQEAEDESVRVIGNVFEKQTEAVRDSVTTQTPTTTGADANAGAYSTSPTP